MPLLGNLLVDRKRGSRSYGRITTIVTPLCALVFIIGAATIQLMILNNVQATAPVLLHGTLSPLVRQSRLVGKVDPAQRIALSIGLRPRNMTELTTYVQEIVRPGSPDYHRFLTPSQVTEAFSPTQESYDGVRNYLRAAGFTITRTYSHRLLITFSGTVEQAEQTFHVTMNRYAIADGRAYYANDKEPVMPAQLAKAVQSIQGLNNAMHWYHSPVSMQKLAAVRLDARRPCPGRGSNYLTPDQYSGPYNLQGLYAHHIQGEGQTVALFELASFEMSDISAYTACFGRSHTEIQTIASGSAPLMGDAGIAEAETDSEILLSAAPQLSTLKVYEAANSANDVITQWAQIIQDAPPVVSSSWSTCELDADPALLQQENLLFMIAAAQGQSIFASSGDSGSAGCARMTGSTQLSATDPASQPFVTGVGGTTLSLHNGSYGEESVWNTVNAVAGASNADDSRASGGGISRYWTAPAWQNAPGVNMSDSSGKPCGASAGAICREVPDVAFSADPHTGYLIYCTAVAAGCTSKHPWLLAGGTSAATPMWAALAALTNELSLQQGGSNLGFVNPLLYSLANVPKSYSNDFHDATKGNNDFKNANGGAYPAAHGYDMATGLGSYNAFNLAKELATFGMSKQGTRSTPVSTVWYFAEGCVGNGFQEFITLHNPSPVQDADVSITYLFEARSPMTVLHKVSKNGRSTVSVNADLHVKVTDKQLALSAIIRTTKGSPGIVAERPMYFSYKGIKSGTAVIGATKTSMSYYFPDVDTRQNGPKYSSYITLLNPDAGKSATARVTYYTGACGQRNEAACPSQKIVIPPLHRSTITPEALSLHQQMAASIEVDQPIVVERALYARDTLPNAGGLTTGAASEVGATTPGNSWLFADGNTSAGFQEYLMLANFTSTATTATITLAYDNGHTQRVNVAVPAFGQTRFDVNAANTNPTGICDSKACQPTTTASAEVTSAAPIVAERLQYFHFGKDRYSGVTGMIGEAGPASHNVYAFAEGYTGNTFQEYLVVQNPTAQDEMVVMTLFADTYVLQRQIVMKAHNRQTISINAWVTPIVQNNRNLGVDSYDVSLTVQAIGDGARIVAERSMYFNYHGNQGGTQVIGFTG